MSTENQKEVQETGFGTDTIGSHDEKGLGSFLKNKRKEKGLSISQLAQMTKLRVHFIEALENEDWDRLPAMVFVKGFLRSYAQAVEWDAEEFLEIYRRVTPQREEIPRPLVVPKNKTWKGLYWVVVGLGIIAIISYYLWTDYQRKSVSASLADTVATQPTHDEVQPPETPPAPVDGSPTPIEPPKWSGELRLVQDEVPADDAVSTSKNYVLKSSITMRTWVKIYIDEEPPKEYLFNPGETHVWKANEGFDILVGNAAGIEFDFNGEKITNLGEPAKVVRVRFPVRFQSILREE